MHSETQFINLISNSALVIAASRADKLVPHEESRALFDAAPGHDKWWVEVDCPGHKGLLQSTAMQKALEPVIQQVLPCGKAAAPD
jgi:hypothetical protein